MQKFAALTLLFAACLAAANAQTLPCPTSLSASTSGYQNVAITDANIDSYLNLANTSFFDWLSTQDNFTACNTTNTVDGILGLRQACTQTSGSTNNTAIQYFVIFDCPLDETTAAEDRIVLDALFSTAAGGAPQLTQTFQDEDIPAEEIIEEGVPVELVPAPAPATTAAASQPPASGLRTFNDLNS